MATKRHKRCAELLGQGASEYDAMIGAGWPEGLARGMAPRIRVFLASAGVRVPESAPRPSSSTPTPPASSAAPSEPVAETAPETAPATPLPAPTQTRRASPKGRK